MPMKMAVKLLLFLLFLLVLPDPSPGKAAPSSVKTGEPLQVRIPDPARLKSLQADDAFQYRQPEPPVLSFWDRFWRKIAQVLNRLFYQPKSGRYGTYILYALGVGIIGWAILRLQGVELSSLFGRKAQSLPIPYETYQENIHEINFPALIAQAEVQGDYRRAIRLYYLSILKKLTDKALIAWSPSKTNWCYVHEIQHPHLHQPFEKLTRQFEYIWYGGSALPEPVFQQVRLSFEEFDYLVKTKA
jgi:hypothetical protein